MVDCLSRQLSVLKSYPMIGETGGDGDIGLGLENALSTSDAAVQVAPSYGEYQVPLDATQAAVTTTLVPSRLRTVSRVLQVPEMVIQVGNRSRE